MSSPNLAKPLILGKIPFTTKHHVWCGRDLATNSPHGFVLNWAGPMIMGNYGHILQWAYNII